MRKLDIGICSYGRNHQLLRRVVAAIRANTVSDFTLFIIHNPSEGDGETRDAIEGLASEDPRIQPFNMAINEGYGGAVNRLISLANTPYVAYADNDAVVNTAGWDERFAALLDSYQEIGQVYPGTGHFGFDNGSYHECLWNAGYFWMIRRDLSRMRSFDDQHGTHPNPQNRYEWPIDTSLGHHDEVDLMIRLRFAGYQIACCPDVDVKHEETATNANPADHQPGGRIHDGVVRWQNKWCRYHCGDQLKYSMTKYDERMLRFTDWPTCALYLERMSLHYHPQMNANPREVYVPGVGNMDAIEVLKPTGCYRRRAI